VDDFFDSLAGRSGLVHRTMAQARMGTVVSSNSRTATAKVLLQPERVLTGWLPVLTQWAGSGWGMACPPSPGDQVLVIPQEGDPQLGLIIGRLYSNLIRAPDAEPGEMTFSHQSGCSIRLLNSGMISINGDLHVSGDVYDSYGSLSRLRNDYNAHIHYVSGQETSVPLPLD
jgi:phage baseplate assembly protein V